MFGVAGAEVRTTNKESRLFGGAARFYGDQYRRQPCTDSFGGDGVKKWQHVSDCQRFSSQRAATWLYRIHRIADGDDTVGSTTDGPPFANSCLASRSAPRLIAACHGSQSADSRVPGKNVFN